MLVHFVKVITEAGCFSHTYLGVRGLAEVCLVNK